VQINSTFSLAEGGDWGGRRTWIAGLREFSTRATKRSIQSDFKKTKKQIRLPPVFPFFRGILRGVRRALARTKSWAG